MKRDAARRATSLLSNKISLGPLREQVLRCGTSEEDKDLAES
jgi:hypothetical protein